MTDLSSKTFAVFDHFGLFVGLAKCLAKSGARVLYSTPVDRRDSINEALMGDGFSDIKCVDEFWPHKSEIDCFVFPDIRHDGLQGELRSQKLPVWGSQRGMALEQDRQFFLKKLRELGLDVPPHEEITGVTNLGLYLKDEHDIWIKVSKWRGSWETYHWCSWDEDWHQLDKWAAKFGGVKETMRFICFPKIETDLEIGADTYCVDGRWPQSMLHGIERKNKAYFSAVNTREKMPDQLVSVMDAFSPYLKQVGYRNQWSMENRVTDSKNYFIDATTRGGLPSTPSFTAAKNTPEVIYHGARGEFVEVDYGFKFSAECAVKLPGGTDDWETVILKPELKDHFFAQQCCESDKQLWFPPSGDNSGHIGWLFVTGDTPVEVAEEMNRLADMLPDGADAQVEALSDCIKEVELEEEQGIHFTDQDMPDPNIVLEGAK